MYFVPLLSEPQANHLLKREVRGPDTAPPAYLVISPSHAPPRQGTA